MAAIKDLLVAAEGALAFGDYELAAKTKKSDFEHEGDIYKVKTYKDITRLEKNDALVYESVPGTAVTGFKAADGCVSFSVEGPEDADITLELEDDKEYEVLIDDVSTGTMKTGLGGKLTFGVELSADKAVKVLVRG